MQRAFPGTEEEGRGAGAGQGRGDPEGGQAGATIDFRLCYFSGSERKGKDKPDSASALPFSRMSQGDGRRWVVAASWPGLR